MTGAYNGLYSENIYACLCMCMFKYMYMYMGVYVRAYTGLQLRRGSSEHVILAGGWVGC